MPNPTSLSTTTKGVLAVLGFLLIVFVAVFMFHSYLPTWQASKTTPTKKTETRKESTKEAEIRLKAGTFDASRRVQGYVSAIDQKNKTFEFVSFGKPKKTYSVTVVDKTKFLRQPLAVPDGTQLLGSGTARTVKFEDLILHAPIDMVTSEDPKQETQVHALMIILLYE